MADISKIKLANGTTVLLKDAQGRTDFSTLLGTHALEALKAAAWLGADTSITTDASDANVATTKATKAYVDAQVGAINKFDVVVADSLPTASADTMYKIYLIPDAAAVTQNIKKEYITIRSGSEGAYTYSWEQIGTTETDLTQYVKKITKVAGITLEDDITVSELQVALGLGKMAYADTATGSTTLDTIDTITMDKVTVAGNATVTTTSANATLTKANYTPAGSITGSAISDGSITVTVKDATNATAAELTKADYTPAGSVTGDAIKGGSITVTVKDAASATSAVLTKADYTPAGTIAAAATDGSFSALKSAAFQKSDAASAVQIEGTVSKPDITVTPSTESVLKSISKAAVAPTFTQGAKAALTAQSTANFSTEGITAAVGSGDDAECLIFTAASTSAAVTDRGTFTANGDDTFTEGSAAEFNTQDVVTGATAALDAAPTFTGSKYDLNTSSDTALKNVEFTGTTQKDALVTGATYLKQEIDTQTFTPEAATLGFSGTKAENVLVTGVSYLKQEIDEASFTGTAASLGFSGTEVENALVTAVAYDKADANAAYSTDVTPTVASYAKTAKSISITASPDTKA